MKYQKYEDRMYNFGFNAAIRRQKKGQFSETVKAKDKRAWYKGFTAGKTERKHRDMLNLLLKRKDPNE